MGFEPGTSHSTVAALQSALFRPIKGGRWGANLLEQVLLASAVKKKLLLTFAFSFKFSHSRFKLK